MNKTVALAVLLVAFLIYSPLANAATEEEIEESILNGLVWLAAQQNTDGSWPHYNNDYVAPTGLAVLKFEDRAIELGFESPFDPEYEYHQNVIDGLNFLFGAGRIFTQNIGLQDHTAGESGTIDDPDWNGNGMGVYAHGHAGTPYDCYDTGIVLSAIAASFTPSRIVNVPGSPVDGWTYGAVAQDMVDWLAWAQSDAHIDYGGGVWCGEGGWTYAALDNTGYGPYGHHGSDQSNTGYAVLGLSYAADPGFGATIPAWVATELNAYVGCIQDPVDNDPPAGNDGGSWYSRRSDGIGCNILKTGNLIFEMTMVGDGPGTQRMLDALDYLTRHWNDPSGPNSPPGWNGNPAQYQAMFTAMKGLEFSQIDDFNAIDWFADFSDAIVAQQIAQDHPDPNIRGSWQSSSGRGNPTLITAWALLTLEKASPPPPIITVELDIKPTSCPNPLNVKSKGVLPVAILGTDEFDVSTVDRTTVKLEGVPAWGGILEDVATPVEPSDDICECTEEGPDGYMDMTFKFPRQAVIDSLGEVEDGEMVVLTLKGQTYEGVAIEGQDCVRIIKKGRQEMQPGVLLPVQLVEGELPGASAVRLLLPERTRVSVIVYDVMGRKVKTLVNGYLDRGTNTIDWDGRDESGNVAVSGIYFCNVKAGTLDETVKMIQVK
jgi:hypothetical protein